MINNNKMHTIKSIIYFICILAILVAHGNALIGKKNGKTPGKSGCHGLGEICKSTSDCCGHDDPESGHCVICYSFWSALTGSGHDRCKCTYDGATVDPETHRVTSNVCNGPDNSGNSVCSTRVAPPGDRYYRGNKLF